MLTYSSPAHAGLERALSVVAFLTILPAVACGSKTANTTKDPSPAASDEDDEDDLPSDVPEESDAEDDRANSKDAGARDAGSKIDGGASGGGRIDASFGGTEAGAPDTAAPDAEDSEPMGPSRTMCSGEQVPVNGKCVDKKLPEQLGTGWVRVDAPAPATCIYGAPYSFYVRKGTVNKAMLFFQGGGACWDDTTCLLPIYSETPTAPGSAGILDPNNPKNPFKDYYIVYAPYCSGDVGLGDSTRDYASGKAQHKGFVNMTAVRNWIYENITAPEFMFISGCSAGAVGVTLTGSYIVDAYSENPNVDGAMVTDSFQAIIPDGFIGLENWNVAPNFPDWLPKLKSLKAPFPGDIMAQGIKEALALPSFSRFVAANFNYADDGVQGLFYGFMGGDATQIGKRIKDAVHDISASAKNYRYFLAPGSSHCVFESAGIYNLQANGTSLIDWLGDVAQNKEVKSVE